MFDFAWSEIALIGVVALVLIGPKDMPVAIKAISGAVKKARRMAAEFQTHVDDLVKDAELGEVRDHIRDIRSLNIRSTIARAVDSDGSIRKAFADPMRDTPAPTVVETRTEPVIDTPFDATPPTIVAPAVADAATPPAFIPPADAPAPVAAAPMVPPAFIPPEAAHVPAQHA